MNAFISKSNEFFTWHCQLGHLYFYILWRIFPHLSFSKHDVYCEPFQLVKHYWSIYPIIHNNNGLVLFSLVHSDVWGPSLITSLSSFKYFVTFVDDCSRATLLYLLKMKGHVSTAFKLFYHMVCT